MKQFKSLMALLLAAILVVGLAVSANAVNISIERDSTYKGSGTGNTYTYYKVFDAVVTSGTSITNADGHTSGTANVLNPQTKGVSYIASADVKNALDVKGNNWFVFTPIAGSTNFNVSWKAGTEVTAANMQAAAAFILEKGAYTTHNTLTMNNGKWEATVDPGYYVIQGAAGNNLIAATTDISIKEKNSYPPLDKTQADEDKTTQNDETRDVAVGDQLTYNVKVTVPATAKVGDTILVWDKATEGLTFDNNVTSDADSATDVAIANGTGVAGAAWVRVITIKDTSAQGKEITFSFTMTVNSSALVDTGKENEAGLKYGNSGTYTYDSIPDRVEYKTYYAGIHKFDGDNSGTDLKGVKFTLKEGSGSYAVLLSGSYYYPSTDSSASATVETDANGMIIIRGLDKDKKYTLTEIETLDGYNKLAEDIELKVYEDEASGTALTNAKTSSVWNQVPNYKGTILPSTGGIGTTIFYVVGAVLVLGAAAIMIARRKAEQE